MNLQLSLIGKWFDLTAKEVEPKTEDYRSITPYWSQRLVLVKGKQMPLKWWNKVFEDVDYIKELVDFEDFLDYTNPHNYSFKSFTQTTITKGYPKKTDTSKIAVFEHKEIIIDYGKEEWGAEKGVLYFVIKHGKRQ